MRKEELRLGNYAKFKDKEVIVFTLGERFMEYAIEKDDEFIYCEAYEDIEPIQITEEILLKIEGVEKDKNQPDRYILKDTYYTFEIEDGYWEHPCIDIMKNGVYIICVEFLHELQNTMFWLLKEELKIEL